MEQLLKILETSEEYSRELRLMKEKFVNDFRAQLHGPKPTTSDTGTLSATTPQQIKKRVKRLSDLSENDAEVLSEKMSPPRSTRLRNSKLLGSVVAMEAEQNDVISETSDISTKATNSIGSKNKAQTEEQLMPPPPVPVAPAPNDTTAEISFARPQRAAKLKSEKNLKEPKLSTKLRRPSNCDITKVKLEHEQRPSQMARADSTMSIGRDSCKSTSSSRSEESVVAVATKAASVVEIQSEDENISVQGTQRKSDEGKVRSLRIKVKREKSSTGSIPETNNENPLSSQKSAENNVSKHTLPMPKISVKSDHANDDSTLTSTTITTNTTSSTTTTRRRKKKDAVPKPIKVERFSDIVVEPRKQRKGRNEVRVSGVSVYEDAVDQPIATDATNTPPTRTSSVPPAVAAAVGMDSANNSSQKQFDKTVTVTAAIVNDATFCANAAQTTFQIDAGQATFVMDTQNGNVTVTMDKKSAGAVGPVGDTTYNVPNNNANDNSATSSHQSMETAKDTTHPQHESLITEDESFEKEKQPKGKFATLPKPGPTTKLGSAKYRMPVRTNELFNPLVQSPVKKKVEAFENAAIAAHNTELTNTGRPKRTKENTAPSSITTPTIGKMASAPALGRFLTPTQSSNLTGSVRVKKVPSSASKALPNPKALTSVKSTSNITSAKTLSRENSAEDFRKGLHSLAEERKKQREQKHLIAAQQREARERERAERAAKLVKEREEKRLKKQQEAEQKKQALEEIQRNLRQQEELAKLKAAKAKADQERELLQQMKQQNARTAPTKMLPPPPKIQSKYTFEMLHEDDSTDDEEKTSYKRPPPPTWSRSSVRGPAIRMQQYWPTKIIDSFFSIQPLSPDLRIIFPNISSHHLKRNSSVLWSTPPRYSELPKY